jgi:hypothetical protein
MKTRIWTTDSRTVCLHTVNPWEDEPRTREFWVPRLGGYVREIDDTHPGTLGRQVCRGLAHRGDTLYLGEGGDLLDLIRHEYRRMYREYRRTDDDD